MSFKTAFLICALIAVTKGVDINYKTGKDAAASCAKENNVKDLKKALGRDSKDPNAKCLKHCIALKLNLITESGDPVVEQLDTLQDHNMTAFTQDCAKLHTDSDKCERVNKMSSCFKEKSKQLMKTISAECAAETNTKVENVKSLAKNFMANALNTKMHCYYRCVLIKMGVMDADSNLNSKFKPLLAGSKYENIGDHFEKCAEENTQEDACAKTAQRVICVGKKVAMNKLFG